MAHRSQNRNRVRDLREVIEARRAARIRASAQARQETIFRARTVAHSMLSSGERYIAEMNSTRPNTQGFIVSVRVSLSTIARDGLAAVMRRVLQEYPMLNLFEPASVRNLQLSSLAWNFGGFDQPIVLEWEFVNSRENM